jgi:hypothetical protein
MLPIAVLVVTGAEALYADMGHFGARAIRLGWFAIVMPALTLCYLGQGAMVLAGNDSFFALAPAGAWRYGFIGLATAATVIASQALIAGAFSLTRQAVRLGLFPRVTVKHTSDEREGQLYVPLINWGLASGCIGLVLIFQHSQRLASAYGVAVTGTMSITSVVFYEVARTTWRWAQWKAALLVAVFLSFDVPFAGATLFKFVDGGFIPVLVGSGLFVIMVVWNNGRDSYRHYLADRSPPLERFLPELAADTVARLPGAGVFLTSRHSGVPPALARLVELLRTAPRELILLTVQTLHRPYGTLDDLRCDTIGPNMHRIVVSYGFMEEPDVPEALARASARFGVPSQGATINYFTERDTFLATSAGRMNRINEMLFSLLARNARPLTDHFQLPAAEVIEIGSNSTPNDGWLRDNQVTRQQPPADATFEERWRGRSGRRLRLGLVLRLLRFLLGVVDGPRRMLRRRVGRVELEGLLAGVTDIVAHPPGYAEDAVLFHRANVVRDDRLSFALHEEETLIDGVGLGADVFVRGERHRDHLDLRSSEQHMPEVLVLFGELLDVAVERHGAGLCGPREALASRRERRRGEGEENESLREHVGIPIDCAVHRNRLRTRHR